MGASRIRRARLQVRGSQSYVSSRTFRIAFDDVTPIPGAMESYVAGVEIAVDAVWEKTNAGTASLPAIIAHRVIESMFLTVGSHRFIDLPSQAGIALNLYEWFMTGRRPPNTAAITIPAAAGTVTARLKFFIPFTLPNTIEPDDANVPLSLLKGEQAQIEATWVNGGVGGAFDAGADDERLTAATQVREATVILVGRDHYRDPVMWTMSRLTVNQAQEQVPIIDSVPYGIIEIPTQANGLTENFLTDAERDRVTLEVGGQTPVQNIDAIDLVASWDRIHAVTNDDRQGDHEGNATRFVPIYFPHRRNRKLTHMGLVRKDSPKLTLNGSQASGDFVWMAAKLAKGANVLARMSAAGQRVHPEFQKNPGQFLEEKTFGKSAQPGGAEGKQRFPAKVNLQGSKRRRNSSV